MAKLDDFGRPIYETAEEYNKAHKGGVCPRPYDSPTGENYQQGTSKTKSSYQSVAQKYATVQGSRKATKMVIAIGLMILVLNVVVILSMFGNIVSDSGVNYYEEEVYSFDEHLGDTTTPLTEGFELFSYNGQYYRIPTNYWKISQMGFVSDLYSENDTFPAGYEELIDLYDEDGCMRAMIRINNNTEQEIPLGECMVDYMYIENPTMFYETAIMPDFKFGDGLTFESSYEEAEDYFGVPYWHYREYSKEGDCFDIYQWQYFPKEAGILEIQDDIEFVEIKFVNNVIESVSIEKKAYEKKP